MRLLCTTLLATLLGLGSCADKNSGLSSPSGPDTTTQGGDPSFGTPGLGDSTTTNPAAKQIAADSSTPVSNGPPDGQQDPPEPIPEPSTILLFGLGVTGLAVYRRRRLGEANEASIA